MTVSLPSDPAGRDALAGEYVLGTLDGGTAQAVRAALPGDPTLQAAVDAWERRLAPLSVLAPAVEPPPGTWEAIAKRIGAAAATPTRRTLAWRSLFGGGLAGAAIAGLAALLLLRPPAPIPAAERFVAVMQPDRAAPAWVVEADRNNVIRINAVNRQAVPADRVMQLWGLAPGDAGPTSLGFVPAEGGQFTFDARVRPPVDGMLVEISLEPPGGSPIGRPTGPILFIGRLERVQQ